MLLFCVNPYSYVLMMILQVATMIKLYYIFGTFCLFCIIDTRVKTVNIDGEQIKIKIWYVAHNNSNDVMNNFIILFYTYAYLQ